MTVPPVARSSPASTISRLVLPDPEGPTSPIASPRLISRSMPRNMLTGPAAEGTVNRRPRTRTKGEVVPGDAAPEAEGGVMELMAVAYGVLAERKNPGNLAVGRKSSWWLVFLAFLFLAVPVMAAPPRVLVLGDSLTAGYGLAREDGFQARLQAALRARGNDAVLIDGAVSGDTSFGGRSRLDWSLGEGADAAIVELGANDGLRGLDPAEMEANLGAILDTLAARHIPVLLSGMYAPPNFGRDYQNAFRAAFDRLGARPGILYDPFFLDGIAAEPALNQADRLHPNAEGVRRIVTRLLPLVERLLAAVPR